MRALLGCADPLPARPWRVVVAGTSGSGKTTLAARIGHVLGVEHIEIDALFHGPGWTPRPTFLAHVEEFSTRPGWVTEWQYSSARDLLADRCDLVVWLDPPHTTVMRQVTARTLRRRVRREVLWNGNLEPPLRTFLSDRDHVVRWAWRTRYATAERIARLRVRRPELPVVRLRSRAEADRWVAGPLTRTGDARA
ncbi:adenylate kinase [Pseudonocardia sulfidoxydans NBRC 16205]|uniref:Adenylate kinase n=1 Tax=Pseudonocardia sulfidoxydans NBRC 16205 TaxID=1223511 RepID=A0A511DCB4_9PSEU|nr:AAA family ATPase [Pseudonocardia sulfidoxydans]GEL22432.1 adenylate kinase [Pseudonocardia sulfidoxydans NBRC 16205]